MVVKKTIDVAALGEAMVEFNQATAGQPTYLQGFGGDTSNAVIAAARAGVQTAYLTRLGADTFGDALMALWQREGVDTLGIERDETAPTGIYFVTHGPASSPDRQSGQSGHEFSYRRAGSAASAMTPAWLTQSPHGSQSPTSLIASAKILHLSGISLAISPQACDTAFAAMQLARQAKTLVSFDSNLRLKLWPLERARACVRQAVSLCDIFLPSLEDMTSLTGLAEPEAILDWGHQQGAKTVVLKLGSDGALVSDGTRRMRLVGHRVPLVDATGAGDCFCGNLLARIALGDVVFEAAHYANAAAALAVQGYSAVGPLPYPAAVRALMKTSTAVA